MSIIFNNINKKIEEIFKDESLKIEAKQIVKTAFESDKIGKQASFIESSKSSDEIKFRIDCLKSILVQEGIINQKESDKFGNILFIDCETP